MIRYDYGIPLSRHIVSKFLSKFQIDQTSYKPTPRQIKEYTGIVGEAKNWKRFEMDDKKREKK